MYLETFAGASTSTSCVGLHKVFSDFEVTCGLSLNKMAAKTCEEIAQRISTSTGEELLEALQDLSALLNSPSYNLRDVAPLVPAY